MDNKLKKVDVPIELKYLIPQFLINREKEIINLEQAAEVADYTRLSHIGHSMRGSCGGYGFDILSSLGTQIELAAIDKKIDDIKKNILEYKDILKNVQIHYVE